MPLILAIEPDRPQAAMLAAVIREGVEADLVIAESPDRAFDLLAGRIPDLILTPSLFAPRDEAVVVERLRQLGDAALHVQTVTVPQLGTVQADEPRRGVLSSFLGSRPAAEGCDPVLFAEHLAVYLGRAAEAREALESPAGRAAIAPSPDVVLPHEQDREHGHEAGEDTTPSAQAELEPPEAVWKAEPLPREKPAAVSEQAVRPRTDDWRFFDPAQPHFAALLARLRTLIDQTREGRQGPDRRTDGAEDGRGRLAAVPSAGARARPGAAG